MSDTTQKRTFEPLDELRYGRIGSARLSPNGQWVVYDLTENDIDKEETYTTLWRVDLESGETRRLTYENCKNATPEWSPDGTQIAFLSNRDGVQQVYLMPSEGGEARKLTTIKQGVARGPAWSPDGKSIAFTVGPAEKRDPKKPYRVTRFVYRFDGLGNLDDCVQNIYVQGVDGGEPKQLTNDQQMNHTMRWSPDGREILYLASHDPDMPTLFSAKLRAVDLDGNRREVVGLDFGFILNANWSPDGEKIVFAAATGATPMANKFDLWVIDRAGGTPENRTADLPWGVNYEWISTRNEKLLNPNVAYVNVVRGGSIGIYSVALDGEQVYTPLIEGERSLSLRDANSEHLLYLSSALENPGELYLANLDGSGERQITRVNQKQMDEIAFPKVQKVTYKSEGGVDIDGWLLFPVNGKPPYPTILYIHGGPHGWYGFNYGSDFQMLAGAGYLVFFTNPRGSKGYGDAFASALSGNWGVMDYKDLMAGVDYIVDQGLADPDRLGVAGLSYGGFMTTFTVGQTRRFKAAVAENPITDLVSRYGTADMGPWGSLSELGGKPHEIPEVYRQSSPITYAHTCTTPTLLIQGEADYRCPIGQSEQFYSHLKANGCIVEMVRFPEMSHLGSITGPVYVQKSQNDELLGWMNKYVLGMG